MLNDAELKRLFETLLPGEPKPGDGKGSAVQPASIDLSIGQIYIPDVEPEKLGGVEKPLTETFSLKAGHTAVVTTREKLHVPPTHGAIGFPPTTISNNAILMTNPGHVDPGYEGYLTFTVINMGREPFPLTPGDRIVTMLFFRLEPGRPDRDYAERLEDAGVTPGPAVTEERMSRLAPDMLDIEERVRQKTESAEAETRRLSIKVPLVLAIVVGAG